MRVVWEIGVVRAVGRECELVVVVVVGVEVELEVDDSGDGARRGQSGGRSAIAERISGVVVRRTMVRTFGWILVSTGN
jgi:hypothetical protein